MVLETKEVGTLILQLPPMDILVFHGYLPTEHPQSLGLESLFYQYCLCHGARKPVEVFNR